MNEYRGESRGNGRPTSRIAVSDIGVERDFARARRHSQRVRILRLAVPMLIVAGVVIYFVSAGLPGADLPIDFDNVVVDGEGIVIEAPRLTRYTVGDQYELVAERAVQPAGNPDQLRLEGVVATYQFTTGESASFTAPFGEYNAATSVVALSGGVTMTMGNGVELIMETVLIDVPNNMIVSDQAFALDAGTLSVRGNELQLNGDAMRIAGGVETVFEIGGPMPRLPQIGTLAP